MTTLKLTAAETKRLRSVLEWRIEHLNNDETPDEWRKAMWPISESESDMEEYRARYNKRQQSLAQYQSILGKLV